MKNFATWKFIDSPVNPSLATNGNEQLVWVFVHVYPLPDKLSAEGKASV